MKEIIKQLLLSSHAAAVNLVFGLKDDEIADYPTLSFPEEVYNHIVGTATIIDWNPTTKIVIDGVQVYKIVKQNNA